VKIDSIVESKVSSERIGSFRKRRVNRERKVLDFRKSRRNKALYQSKDQSQDQSQDQRRKHTSVLSWRNSQVGASQVLPMANPLAPACLIPSVGNELRFLSYNIQVGITTKRYRQYLTRGWKHLLPHEERDLNLKKIAQVVQD